MSKLLFLSAFLYLETMKRRREDCAKSADESNLVFTAGWRKCQKSGTRNRLHAIQICFRETVPRSLYAA